jgi:hypothetical protein
VFYYHHDSVLSEVVQFLLKLYFYSVFLRTAASSSVQADAGSLGGKEAVCGAEIEGTPKPVLNSNLWLSCH